MNTKEHKKYREEFKKFARTVLASEDATNSFLVDAGINTRTGKLTKNYSEKPTGVSSDCKK